MVAMELHEIVRMMVKSEIATPDEIVIIGKTGRSEKLSSFKHVDCKDIPLTETGAFKAVIVKDADVLKKTSINDIFRIAEKYVLMSGVPYPGADGSGTNESASSEITIIGKDGEIINDMDALVKKERERKGDSGDFLLGLALIQNLKRQIAEKDKTIADKTKEAEIARSEARMFDQYIKNLKGYGEELRTRKDKEISILKEQLEIKSREKKAAHVQDIKEIRKREEEADRLEAELKKRDDNISKISETHMSELNSLEETHMSELNSLEVKFKEKCAEVENLKKEIEGTQTPDWEEREREIVVKFGRQLKKIQDGLEEAVSRCNDVSRRKDLEIERLEKIKDDEIEKLKAELKRIRDAPAYKILSKMRPLKPEP